MELLARDRIKSRRLLQRRPVSLPLRHPSSNLKKKIEIVKKQAWPSSWWSTCLSFWFVTFLGSFSTWLNWLQSGKVPFHQYVFLLSAGFKEYISSNFEGRRIPGKNNQSECTSRKLFAILSKNICLNLENFRKMGWLKQRVPAKPRNVNYTR